MATEKKAELYTKNNNNNNNNNIVEIFIFLSRGNFLTCLSHYKK